MNSVTVLVLALLGTCYANPLTVRDEPVDTAEKWIHCVHIALETGLEAADIPPHDPLWFSNDLSLDILGLYSINITKGEIDGILNYNFTQLEGTTLTDENGIESVSFNWTIYWPDMSIKGDFDFVAGDYHNNGTFAVHMLHLTFSGIWDMVTSGQDVPRQMIDFSLDINVGETSAEVSNLGHEETQIIANAVKVLLNIIPTSVSSAALRERIDTFWIGHPERIDAIIENCKNNN